MKRSELFFAFLQLPIDAAMIILAFVLAYYLRADLGVVSGFNDTGLQEYLKYAIYLLPVWIVLFAANGLYSVKNTTGFFNEFYKISVATSTAILFFVILIFFSKTLFFSRLILVFIWIISITVIMLGRLILRSVRRLLLSAGVGVRNVLLIGNNSAAIKINNELAGVSSGLKVVGIVGSGKDAADGGMKILGDLDNLKLILKKYAIDEVILTDSNLSQKKIMEIIQTCSDIKAGFKYIPDTLALIASNFKPGLIGSMPVMELRRIPLEGWGRIAKRIFDFIFSFIFLAILSPLFLVIAILEKLTTKGPVFYHQQRVGRDENNFNCHKFRSWYIETCDFSSNGSNWTTKSDENRITLLGKILRKTNLDELPQLWNILIGDMSFVGPRPEIPKFVQKFEAEIPDYFKRHHVKSGLTGWAQVSGLKGDTSIKDRVRYDIYYIENWSLWLDFKIIVKTIFLIIYEVFNGKFEYRTRP